MTDTSKDTSGASTSNPEDSSSDNQDKQPSYESYQKLLSEKKNTQQKLKAAQDELNRIAAEKADAEKKRLEEQGEFKKIAELKEKQLAETQAKLNEMKERDSDLKKVAAVVKALGGSLPSKYQEVLRYQDVVINPESGEVDELSVKQVADQFKKTWPEAFRSKGPGTDNTAPTSAPNSGKIAYSKWKELPPAEMKKYKPHQIDDHS
jgi:Skp family chaperone for outer membrane proteins